MRRASARSAGSADQVSTGVRGAGPSGAPGAEGRSGRVPTDGASDVGPGTVVGPAADMFAWAATLLFAATGRD
ncbi:hypothetical protein ACSNOI_21010, partial [Actinomadura kijaniata]